MAKSTDLTSDSVDAAAGFSDYRYAYAGFELAQSVSHMPASGDPVGAVVACTRADCSEHPGVSSPVKVAARDEQDTGLPPSRLPGEGAGLLTALVPATHAGVVAMADSGSARSYKKIGCQCRA